MRYCHFWVPLFASSLSSLFGVDERAVNRVVWEWVTDCQRPVKISIIWFMQVVMCTCDPTFDLD